MTLILDSGAMTALDTDDRAMWTRLKGALLDGDVPITHAGAFGQAWTLGTEKTRLEMALAGIEIKALDETSARQASRLVAATDSSSRLLDAALVLLAADDDEILTASPKRLTHIAQASGLHLELVQT